MNWAEYDEVHFQFFDDLIDFYHDSPVFRPNADPVREAYRTDATDDLLVFGRDAGDEKRVVVINFGPKPRQVELRPSVDTGDLFTGEDLALSTSDDATTVEVKALAVFETPALFGQGELTSRSDTRRFRVERGSVGKIDQPDDSIFDSFCLSRIICATSS